MGSYHKGKRTFIEGKHKCENLLYINIFYIMGKANWRTIGVGYLSFSAIWFDILKTVSIVLDVLKCNYVINTSQRRLFVLRKERGYVN